MKERKHVPGQRVCPGSRIILLLLAAVAIQFFPVAQAQSAPPRQDKLTIEVDNKPIVQVLQQVQQTSRYRFVYSNGLLNDKQLVTVHLKEGSLRQLMDVVLRNTSLTFEEQTNGVVVLKATRNKVTQIIADHKISGIVRDSSGAALPGVSVTVKGKEKIGTTTDLNGGYFLEIPDGATLIFSMVGFTAREITPSPTQTNLDVRLFASTNHLEEAVVVAFGKQKKTDVVGSITSVNPQELKVPSSNLTTALAGRVAGMIAYQRSGEPGNNDASFFIRGVTTFGYKVDPLILIDGVEASTRDLANLQVDDIANFSILKDATATALYGARGANGVILIATKQGKEGKPTYSVRAENSVSAPTKNIKLADPITYMKLANEAVATRDPLSRIPYSQEKIEKTVPGSNSYIYPATDWYEELFKDYAMNQRVDANVSGGASVARYYVSATFNQDNGVLKVPKLNSFNSNINLKTYSIRSNVDVNLTKSTVLVTRISGTFQDYMGPINGGAQVYNQVMHSNPVLFPAFYAPDAANVFTRHVLFGNAGAGNYLNPYANMVRGYKTYNTSQINAQAELQQKLNFITPGLTFNAMVNTSRYAYSEVSRGYNPFYYSMGYFDKRTSVYSLNPLNPTTGTEYLDFLPDNIKRQITTSVYFQSILGYSRTINGKHGVSGSLVYQAQNKVSGDLSTLQTSLPARNLGLSGRVTYNYDWRYFGEFNFGYNGSERFDISHRFGFFPSFGLGWNISKENFWNDKLSRVVTNLKLRATYGLVGNDAIGSPQDRFFYLSEVNMSDPARAASFGITPGSMYTRNGISVRRYPNPNITWEISHQTNLGMDLTLWNKLNVVLDVYKTFRSNILMPRKSIPSTVGLADTTSANIGAATSKGIDLSIDYNQKISKDWWIQARANYTLAKSKYDKYEEPEYVNEPWLSRIGYSLSQPFGYIAERLFVDDKDVANMPRQAFGKYEAGDIKYRDINGDGQISSLDSVAIGYPTTPEIVYGFGVSVGYKTFDLSMFFQGQARSSFFIDAAATTPFANNTSPALRAFANNGALLKAYADNYWSEDNRNMYALWPRLSPGVSNNNTRTSTWWMRSGDFLRLKQLEIGYSLTPGALKKWGLKTFRVYLNGSNLFALSTFKLWDIEMAGDGLGYPVQRVVNIGVQTSF